MFSGIIEAQSTVVHVNSRHEGLLELHIEKPVGFEDLQIGDSVSVNGVCLTLEHFNTDRLVFALAAETLQVTQWNESKLLGKTVNVERSLKFGERVHGHLVTGHVDGLGVVMVSERSKETTQLRIKMNKDLIRYCWRKGSVAIQGVSLTLNTVNFHEEFVEVCLVPETLKRTNLTSLREGDRVNVELDLFARGIVETLSRQPGSGSTAFEPKGTL